MELPEIFVHETRRIMGEARFDRFLQALDEEPPVSIRLNPKKVAAEQVVAKAGDVPWCKDGVYLSARPNFTFDPLLHAGVYYVQEASSMFIDHVLRQWVTMPVTMLDMCAAPGGKSTAARAALPAGSLLVSNEPLRQRAQVLAENMVKWGWPDGVVTNNYPKDIRRSGARFDVILCDVPCSGEGMFRRLTRKETRSGTDAVGEWSPQSVEHCRQLQREIVSEAWACLNDGGLLVYSTCTFNTKENEENVRWIAEEMGAEILPVATVKEWGITGSLLEGFEAPVYRFIPGFTQGEGLFVSVLRKRGTWRQTPMLQKRVMDKLTVLYSGQPEPEVKGKKIVPAHAEALQTTFDRNKYPMVELSYAAAVSYLRSEAIVLPAGTPLGFVVVTFRGHPLGFVKNIGNRANNMYPKEWRIRSTYIPEEYEAILRLT